MWWIVRRFIAWIGRIVGRKRPAPFDCAALTRAQREAREEMYREMECRAFWKLNAPLSSPGWMRFPLSSTNMLSPYTAMLYETIPWRTCCKSNHAFVSVEPLENEEE